MRLTAVALEGLPELTDGDDLAELICSAAELEDGDIVVLAQKAVSKVEGRLRKLGEVVPSPQAEELAVQTAKDPRLVELILAESSCVLRATEGVLIVETNHGFVCANAGIDSSNVPGDDCVLLLPERPDRSARELRDELTVRAGVRVAVIVTDSFGRAWRSGQCDVAIGCAGIEPVADLRGQHDRDGRELSATLQCVADELAAAADLARTKSGGQPVVVIRGRPDLVVDHDGPGASTIKRPPDQDLFR
jgi:coenzyme F420-0:L-glutamate ligase/coenzyme F420-1:gamma-L-glutamate ligase